MTENQNTEAAEIAELITKNLSREEVLKVRDYLVRLRRAWNGQKGKLDHLLDQLDQSGVCVPVSLVTGLQGGRRDARDCGEVVESLVDAIPDRTQEEREQMYAAQRALHLRSIVDSLATFSKATSIGLHTEDTTD